MKISIIVSTFLLLFAVNTVTAQTTTNIGIKAGVNSYNISSDNSFEFDPKIGFHAGVIGQRELNNRINIQSEIVFSMQGAELGNTRFNLNYINVPLLIQLTVANGLRVQVGPQIGILVSAETVNRSITIDVMDDFKPVDIGLSVGTSYTNNPTGFGLDARFNIGLNDITESSLIESKSWGIQVGIFYLFEYRNQ